MARSSFITSDLLLAILGLFLPPFPVWIKRGVFSIDSLINIVLTMVGGIPGVIHSWYVVLKYPEDGIPFLDNLIHSNRRQDGEYQTLSDDEESSYTPPQSAAPQSPDYNSSSINHTTVNRIMKINQVDLVMRNYKGPLLRTELINTVLQLEEITRYSIMMNNLGDNCF